MICAYCKRDNAEYHFFTIRSNEIVMVHVCRSCKQEINLEEKTRELGNNLDYLLDSLLHPPDPLDQQGLELSCDRCGTTLKEFKRTNFLGCANCYDVFANSIECVYLEEYGRLDERRVGGIIPKAEEKISGDKEAGEKKPKKSDERKFSGRAEKGSHDKTLAMMMRDLKEAVRLENFEKAAEIRDRIRSFKNKEYI